MKMKRVHIAYARMEGSKSSYHCRTYLDLEVGDKVLVCYSSGILRLAEVTGVKDKDDPMVTLWVVEKISPEAIQSHIERGREMAELDSKMAELDSKMMVKYEEFVRNEGYKELAMRDSEMSEFLTRYKELADEV